MGAALTGLNRTLRWALWLLAAVLIFVALYVSIGRQFMPLLAEYRSEIEQQLQQRLQQPIQIEQLQGGWRGFSPLLEARYVTLGEGTDAVQVETLRIEPDVIASLLSRELRFAKVSLDGLQIHLEENQAGRWALQGLELSSAEETAFGLNDWLGKLQQVAQLSVLNSRVIIQPYGHEPLALTYAGFTLSRNGAQQRLDLRAVLPDGNSLEMSAQGQFIDKDWRQSALAVYLKFPNSNLAQWLPEQYFPDWQLHRFKVAGELWLNAAAGQLQEGALQLAGLELEVQAAHAQPLQLQARIAQGFYQNIEGVHNAWLEHLPLQIDQLPVHDWRILASYENHMTTRLQLAIEQLDLTHVQRVLERVVQLPEEAEDVLSSLQPSGLLRNFNLRWQPKEPQAERLAFVSNLQGVGFSAWQDVPAATGISGHISGGLTAGELRLASPDGFSLHLANLFAQPWVYQQAHAQLLWQFDQQGFSLESPYLQVQGEEGDIAGDFLIRLLHAPEAEDYMDLRVGLRDGDARFTGKYLPSLDSGFDPALDQWLRAAIQAGYIEQGYFQYQGSLNEGAAPESRSMSLYFDVKDAQLEYQLGWPLLTEAAAEVFVEDSGVRVSLTQGKILTTAVTSAYAEVAATAPGQTPVLQLHAELQSNVADGLHILQKTPIAEDAIEFAKWRGTGSLPATLDLRVPMAANEPVQVKLALNAHGAQLSMPEINVQLSDVRGAFLFDNQRGLSAKKISGQFLEQKFSGSIIADGNAQHLRTQIDVQGQLPITRLARWAEISEALPVSGTLPYRLRVMLDGDDSQLRVDSSLLGVKVDLPAPFAKAANQGSYADWRMTLSGAERRYWFEYADQLSLNLAAPAEDILAGRGQLRLGGGLASLPTQKGLQVRGSLSTLDLAAWQALIAQHKLAEQGQETQQLLSSAELNIRHFTGLGVVLDNLSVALRPQGQGWQLLLDSDLVKGEINEQGANQPTLVNLAYLRLPQTLASEVSGSADPLADVDMRSIPALDIQIAALYLGADNLGAWSLTTRPQSQGVLFDKLNLSLKGINVTGQMGWQEDKGQAHSWYKGRLAGANLKDVLLAWGFAPTITSKSFHVDADLTWPGSPALLSAEQLSGDVDIAFKTGQLVSVDGSAQALRIFGLLNFDSIGRRLRLDFSDLVDKGLAYDRVKGRLRAVQGVYHTQTPLRVTGPSSDLQLEGQLDSVNEQVKATLVVTLPITNNLPLAAVAVGAPVVGGALFLVDRLLGDPLSRVASVTYHITGDWHHPNISLFKKGSKK